MKVEDIYRALRNDEDDLFIMDKKGEALFLGQAFTIPLNLMNKNIYSIHAVDNVITIYIDD